jgi:hypothetical protein
VVVVSAFAAATGCYALQPVTNNAVLLGAVLSISINDAGRTALGGTMGPEIREIEGRLVSRDSSEYVLAVTDIRLLSGGNQTWSGERVRVKKEYVNTVNEKRFSRGRTAAFSAVAIVLLGGMFSQAIKGSLAGEEGKLPPDTGKSILYPRFGR